MTMKTTFKKAQDLLNEGKIQESFKEAEKLSFERFLDFTFYCKEKRVALKNPDFWKSLIETKYFTQFFKHSNSHFFLSDFFKQPLKTIEAENLIEMLSENQSECLIKSIRLSKAFLTEEWYSVFEKQFKNNPNKFLKDHFQCFTVLRRIDCDLWMQVEKKSSCLDSLEHSPLEILNEMALWYELNSKLSKIGALRQKVEVLNIAVEYLRKSYLLDIDEAISEKNIIEANLKAWQNVMNFEKNNKITPVFEWLNAINDWHNGANVLLQHYCFDLNFEPTISNEGIISLKPNSVEKIKEWDGNEIKLKLMFNYYHKVAETLFDEWRKNGKIKNQTDQSINQNNADYVNIARISAECAWLDTFNEESISLNKEKINLLDISQFFGEYSGNCLFRWSMPLEEKFLKKGSIICNDLLDLDFIKMNMSKEIYISWLRHDSYKRLITNINNIRENSDSSSLLNLLICNFDQRKYSGIFQRMYVTTNLCSTPFLKFGDNLFVFTSIIANTRPYAFLFDNLLCQNDEILNKGTKSGYKLSAKFEDRINKIFLSNGFSTNLGNDKKFENEDTGEKGDLDALAYKDGCLFVIEAKLAGMRITLEDAQDELSTAFLKGASQLNKAVKFLEYDFKKTKYDHENTKTTLTNIKEKLGIKEESFSDLKICPLIVSTSFESDHELIEWGDKSFLKISWHELMLILSEERNPQKIVERIEKNEFWKFLDVMPTPILTEKSIPIAFLSEPEHPNSEKLSNLANTYYENGKYKAAIISIKQAIEKDENNSNFYIQLGDYYTVNNEIESAKIAYETAIDKDPYNSMAYNSYGCFWQEIYQWKRSYLCFKKAIELNPLDEVIVNSFESSCDYLVDYGIWTNQQKMIKLDELKKRIDQIFEIESIRQFS